jgi:DNA-binding beta-propeller fold protein YncE
LPATAWADKNEQRDSIMKMPNQNQMLLAVLLAVLLGLMAGCASNSKKNAFIFFPPPPDEPRIQYLTSFSSERTLGGHRRFEDFVLGTSEGDLPIVKPYGITIRGDKVYICDSGSGAVDIADLGKSRLNYFNLEGEGQMRVPVNVAVDTNGILYVTDVDRGQILIYSAEKEYLAAIGKKDEMKTSGLVVSDSRIYVGDLKNHCVRVYDKANNSLLFSIPRTNANDKAQLFLPTNLALDQQGRLYVSDTGGFFVKIYDADGNFIRQIGNIGDSFGQFFRNKGIAVDRENQIYVVDAVTSVVQIFDSEGRLLTYLGDAKTSGEGALYLPAGIALDYGNVAHFQKYAAPRFKIEFLIYVTNQVGTHKVSVYGFGHKL